MRVDELRHLVGGAAYLLTNEYERGLLIEKTGWNDSQILSKVGTWITTLGPGGVRMEAEGTDPVTVPAVPAKRETDPTGIGDGFRVGFFAGLAWGLSAERAMQFGCALATTVLEVNGPQEYAIESEALTRRLADAYGEEAAEQVAPFLPGVNA
jgi:adenosine kinase